MEKTFGTKQKKRDGLQNEEITEICDEEMRGCLTGDKAIRI